MIRTGLFLWGLLKSKVYTNKLTTIHALKEELSPVLTKFTRCCAKWSWEFSRKVSKCASKAMESIYLICYSIHNPIPYTSFLYKTNTVFNYKPVYSSKITSCVNFRTPLQETNYVNFVIFLFKHKNYILISFVESLNFSPNKLSFCKCRLITPRVHTVHKYSTMFEICVSNQSN